MRNLLLMCALGLAMTSWAHDTHTTITDYLKGISSETLTADDVQGMWVLNANGYSGEMVEIQANGKAFLHYKNCHGRVKEQVQLVFNGNEVVISDAGSVYFRKINGSVQVFNISMANELCNLYYKGLCERNELLAKLETCWMNVSTRS